MSRPYSKALATRPAVLYIPYATSSHEKTRNIITFAQFEEGNLLGNERNVAKENQFWIQLMSRLHTLTLMKYQ